MMATRRRVNQVKQTARRVVDLGSLPHETVTIDDVIATNDINAVLAEVQEKRADIEGLLVAWRNTNGTISYRYVKSNDSEIVAICEVVKQHLIYRSWIGEH